MNSPISLHPVEPPTGGTGTVKSSGISFTDSDIKGLLETSLQQHAERQRAREAARQALARLIHTCHQELTATATPPGVPAARTAIALHMVDWFRAWTVGMPARVLPPRDDAGPLVSHESIRDLGTVQYALAADYMSTTEVATMILGCATVSAAI